jgi:hypothetical protein
LVLKDVMVSGYAADGDDTALAFNYSKVTETIHEQNRMAAWGKARPSPTMEARSPRSATTNWRHLHTHQLTIY